MMFNVLCGFVFILIAGFLQCGASALSASRRARLEGEAKIGLFGAERALALIDKSDELLELTRIAKVPLIVTSALIWCPAMCSWTLKPLVGATNALGISSLVALLAAALTVSAVIIALTEVIPVHVALKRPELYSRYVSHLLNRMHALLSPIRRGILAGCGAFWSDKGREDLSYDLEEDIRDLVAEGKRAGIIEPGEQEIINRVFKLDDKPVSSVMTPRGDVSFLRSTEDVSELISKASDKRHSWFPVLGDSADEVLGIVSIHDLVSLSRHPNDYTRGVLDLVTEPLQVPESMSALKLLERFRESGARFGLVRDEYGGVAGVVTMYDVLQVIVGNIGDSDTADGEIVQRGDGSFLVDARSDVHDLFESLGIRDERVSTGSGEFRSLGGFVMSTLGYVPKEGERFEASGYHFEVIDMDNKRIDKVLVSPASIKKAASV